MVLLPFCQAREAKAEEKGTTSPMVWKIPFLESRSAQRHFFTKVNPAQQSLLQRSQNHAAELSGKPMFLFWPVFSYGPVTSSKLKRPRCCLVFTTKSLVSLCFSQYLFMPPVFILMLKTFNLASHKKSFRAENVQNVNF